MNSQNVLARLMLGGALASASEASAAIVVFDTNGAFVNGSADIGYGEALFIRNIGLDGSSTTLLKQNISAGQPAPAPPSIRIGAAIYDGPTLYLNGVSVAFAQAGPYLFKLDEGDVVSSGNTFNTIFSTALTLFSSETNYIGLRLTLPSNDVHYGWLELSREDNTLFAPRFAFNDVAGQSILAGQTTAVPEASTLGLVGGLFGLVAAAHLRRRKAKQAAASDKLLALAAGEKLN